MDPVCISMVHQYLKSSNSALVDQFKAKYHPKETSRTLKAAVSKWNEEQLVRALIYQHLKNVTPGLALEFRDCYPCFMESVPKQLALMVEATQNNAWASAETEKVGEVVETCEGKQEHINISQRFAVKTFSRDAKNSFTTEQLKRLERATANKEDLKTVAKEIGRSYESLRQKAKRFKRLSSVNKGKFTSDEIGRIQQALEDNEDYRTVAKELNREPQTVRKRMLIMRSNPKSGNRKMRRFSLEEDFLILEKIIPRLKSQKLSNSTGVLPLPVVLELATEFQRNLETVRGRWLTSLQPWLLQHYTGTAGFRVERMLASLVAEKFTDRIGIDWSEMVAQHKEFAGHTRSSLNQMYMYLFKNCARRRKINSKPSLKEVAEYAAETYQPGKEKKESSAKVAHREKIILSFKKRVDELGIKIMI